MMDGAVGASINSSHAKYMGCIANIVKNCECSDGETIYMFHLNNLPREA